MKINFYIYILKKKKKTSLANSFQHATSQSSKSPWISHHTAIKKVKIKGSLHDYYTLHNTKSTYLQVLFSSSSCSSLHDFGQSKSHSTAHGDEKLYLKVLNPSSKKGIFMA